MTKGNTWTPLPLSVPPFLSNRFTPSCSFSQSKPAFASCPVCCRWMCLQDSPPADCLKLLADLDQGLHLLQHRKILKQARQLSRKETSKKHPLGMPILQERPRVHLTEHLWSLENKLGKKKHINLMKSWPKGKFQSELAMNHKTNPLETKLHYFYPTQNYSFKASLIWRSQQFN